VVIAVYVGYDDNRPMKNAHIRVYGAAGALPIWIQVAQAAVNFLDYDKELDLLELAFKPTAKLSMEWPKDSEEVPVDGSSGLPGSREGDGPRVRTYGEVKSEKREFKRIFAPVDHKR
jgi:membrane peptidoglycan carboxypeptidase